MKLSLIKVLTVGGSFKDDFRVSQLCEQLGFDADKLIKQEYFWLLYDDEVDDSSIKKN